MQIGSRPRSPDLNSLYVWSRCQACFVFLNSFCNSIENYDVLDKVVEKCWCWITILFALTFYCLLSQTRGQQPLQPSHSTMQGAQCKFILRGWIVHNSCCSRLTLQCTLQCSAKVYTAQCNSMEWSSKIDTELFTKRHIANSTLGWYAAGHHIGRALWVGGGQEDPGLEVWLKGQHLQRWHAHWNEWGNVT